MLCYAYVFTKRVDGNSFISYTYSVPAVNSRQAVVIKSMVSVLGTLLGP